MPPCAYDIKPIVAIIILKSNQIDSNLEGVSRQAFSHFYILTLIVVIMNNSTEILSLWVGPNSQEAAHHFYSLQAEQFFDDEEDPTDHRVLWTLKGDNAISKTPKMMIFDTKSDHLTRIRKVNHAKMIKKMAAVNKNEYSFNFFVQPAAQEEPQPKDQKAPLFQNWNGEEDNYVLVDKKFTDDSKTFEYWESLYKLGQEVYEDRIRRRLEKLDYLHILNFCSDGSRLGFSNKLLYHFKDECPKKQIFFTNLSESKSQEYVQQTCLPLLSQISQESSILIDIDVSQPQFGYFVSNFYHHLSPIINCLYTPFMLKQSNSLDYFNQICSGKRNLFDIAFTMPIISDNNELSPSTNIFNYIPNSSTTEHSEEENRINFGNKSFLNFSKNHKQLQKMKKNQIKFEKVTFNSQKVLSEAYVLKGHFNQIVKLCNQRSPLFDIKYLQGIFVTNPEYNLIYTDFYKKSYGQQVEAFPMQTVLYQNGAFGPAIRNYLRQTRSSAMKGQNLEEWRQGAMSLSDLYGEEIDGDSD